MSDQEGERQEARGNFIAQAAPGGIAEVSVTGYTSAEFTDLILAIRRQESESQQLADDLAGKARTTRDAILRFVKILDDKDVPPDDLLAAFNEIITRHQEALARLAALDLSDPTSRTLVTEAIAAVRDGSDYERADQLLAEVVGAEQKAINKAEELERQARTAVVARRQNAAAASANRGDFALVRLNRVSASARPSAPLPAPLSPRFSARSMRGARPMAATSPRPIAAARPR